MTAVTVLPANVHVLCRHITVGWRRGLRFVDEAVAARPVGRVRGEIGGRDALRLSGLRLMVNVKTEVVQAFRDDVLEAGALGAGLVEHAGKRERASPTRGRDEP